MATGTNQLTKAIIEYLQLCGHQAERISTTGRYIERTVKSQNYLTGGTSIAKRGKWIPTSGQKGSADISATIRGQSVKIEIKWGKDRQSEAQKRYQQQVERAGGLYWLVSDWNEFVSKYQSL